MSEQPFHLTDEPSEVSESLLIRSLKTDSAARGVSPKIYAHRSRVIRQQRELLTLKVATGVGEECMQLAKRMRKATRAPDHREEGGQG